LQAEAAMKRQKRETLAEVNLLDLTPVRVAAWEDIDDRVVILRPPPKTRGVKRAIDRLLFEMSTRRIRLDALGSAAWHLIDGERTVAAIAVELRTRFGEDVEPAEERLATLLHYFHRQLFVEFPGIDDD
jgi:hypothetical protein